jgi:hypothetical protein
VAEGRQFFFSFFFQFFYSVMPVHTGGRGGDGRGGGRGMAGVWLKGGTKIFFKNFSIFFHLVILLCGGGNMSAVAAAEKFQKFSKKNFI